MKSLFVKWLQSKNTLSIISELAKPRPTKQANSLNLVFVKVLTYKASPKIPAYKLVLNVHQATKSLVNKSQMNPLKTNRRTASMEAKLTTSKLSLLGMVYPG